MASINVNPNSLGFNLVARDQAPASAAPTGMTQADLQSAIALANINPQSIIFGGLNSLLGVSSPSSTTSSITSSLFPSVPTINNAEQALAAGLNVSQSVLSSPLVNPLGFGLNTPTSTSLFQQQPSILQQQPSILQQPVVEQPVVQTTPQTVTTPQTILPQVPLSTQQQLFQLPGVNTLTRTTGTGPVINIIVSPEQAQALPTQTSLLSRLTNTITALTAPLLSNPAKAAAVKTPTPTTPPPTTKAAETPDTKDPPPAPAAKAPAPAPPPETKAAPPPPPPPPPPAPAPPPFVIPPVQTNPVNPFTTEHTITTDAEADTELAKGKDALDRIDGVMDGKYSDQDLIKVLQDTNGVYDGNLRSAVRYTLQKHLDAATASKDIEPAPPAPPPAAKTLTVQPNQTIDSIVRDAKPGLSDAEVLDLTNKILQANGLTMETASTLQVGRVLDISALSA